MKIIYLYLISMSFISNCFAWETYGGFKTDLKTPYYDKGREVACPYQNGRFRGESTSLSLGAYAGCKGPAMNGVSPYYQVDFGQPKVTMNGGTFSHVFTPSATFRIGIRFFS